MALKHEVKIIFTCDYEEKYVVDDLYKPRPRVIGKRSSQLQIHAQAQCLHGKLSPLYSFQEVIKRPAQIQNLTKTWVRPRTTVSIMSSFTSYFQPRLKMRMCLLLGRSF